MQEWFVLIGIMDGIVTVYDLGTYKVICQLPDTKGARMYCIHEQKHLLCVVQSKRLTLYERQGSDFALTNDISLPETPRTVLFTGASLLVGYRKHYEALTLQLSDPVKVINTEKEHLEVSVEVRMPGYCYTGLHNTCNFAILYFPSFIGMPSVL